MSCLAQPPNRLQSAVESESSLRSHEAGAMQAAGFAQASRCRCSMQRRTSGSGGVVAAASR